MKALGAGLALLALTMSAHAAQQLSPSQQNGRAFAESNCASCHSIELTGASPLEQAPPFRDLHNMYPVEALEESLAEGIRTGHPGMPEFHLEPEQIEDFIAYLKTLE